MHNENEKSGYKNVGYARLANILSPKENFFEKSKDIVSPVKKSSVELSKSIYDKFSLAAKESILIDTEVSYPEGFDEQASQMLKSGECFPIVIASHKAHPGAFGALKVALRLRNLSFPELQLNGSTLLVAANIDGGQNEAVTDSFHAVRPILEQLEAVTAPVLRWKDMKNMTREILAKMLKSQKARLRKDIVDDSLVPVMLPEASVESGRQIENGFPGEIKGMINLEKNSITNILKIVKETGKEPLLFFVGNTGENRIYDPITESVTMQSKIIGIIRALPGGKYIAKSIMKSVVDYPVSLREIINLWGTDGKLADGVLEQYCGERLAQLIPYHERGVYKEPTLLSKVSGIRTRIENITIYEKAT